MRKWKLVGSVTSGDDRSFRSNQSRDQIPSQSFKQSLRNKSEHHSPEKDKSFCFDYFEKKRSDRRNQSYDIGISDHDIKNGRKDKQDIFTSMRNVMKEEPIDSRITSKNTGQQQQKQKPAKDQVSTVRDTLNKVQSLKKQHKKLKRSLQQEVQGLKNLFYQFQEVSYMHLNDQNKPQKTQQKSFDTQFLKQMILEASSVERYFAEMDRKKAQLMSRLNNQ